MPPLRIVIELLLFSILVGLLVARAFAVIREEDQ